jgi:ABC-type sugar transport system ATPase subunit
VPSGVGTRRVEVGIRPEHVRFVSADTVASIPATVELVESLGHEQLVRCAVDGGTVIARCPADGRVPERLSLAVDVDHVHLFDADTGDRLDG